MLASLLLLRAAGQPGSFRGLGPGVDQCLEARAGDPLDSAPAASSLHLLLEQGGHRDELIAWGIGRPDPALLDQPDDPRPGASPIRILDVGCGAGGTAVRLAQRWAKSAHVTGITLSGAQARAATELARSHRLENRSFVVGDAMHSGFAASSVEHRLVTGIRDAHARQSGLRARDRPPAQARWAGSRGDLERARHPHGAAERLRARERPVRGGRVVPHQF